MAPDTNVLLSIAKISCKIGTSLSDVASDILNGINFINGTGYSLFPVVRHLTHANATPNFTISNTKAAGDRARELFLESPDNCTDNTDTDEQHLVWGYLSIALIFLPGLFLILDPAYIRRLINEMQKQTGFLKTILTLMVILLQLIYPLTLLIFLIIALVRPNSESNKKDVIRFIGLEAFFESFPQLVLQLFTISYKYEITPVQAATMAASTFLLGKTAIEFDISVHDIKLPSIKKTIVYVVRILPLYMSGIVFRILAFVVTLVYLRYWAILPITLLLLESTFITGICVQWRPEIIYIMALSNLSVPNVGMVKLLDGDYLKIYPLPDNINEKLKRFLKVSSCITFLHHTLCLAVIMCLVTIFPGLMEHWSCDLISIFQPDDCNFKHMFIYVITAGVVNLFLVIYATRDIKLDKREEISKAKSTQVAKEIEINNNIKKRNINNAEVQSTKYKVQSTKYKSTKSAKSTKSTKSRKYKVSGHSIATPESIVHKPLRATIR